MNRTTLTATVAGALAAVSLAVSALRFAFDKYEPAYGWKVSAVVQGKSAGDARVTLALPFDGPRQHVLTQTDRGEGFTAKTHDGTDGQRTLTWTQPPGSKPGPFRLYYEAVVTLDPAHIGERSGKHMAPPQPGEYLRDEPAIERDHPLINAKAQELAGHLTGKTEKVAELYQFVVQRIVTEPTVGESRTAAECLVEESGDPAAKARLLVALCRNRGIPARLVTGLILGRTDEQMTHVWVEAWLPGHWWAMDPFYQHNGRLPRTYLALAHGDTRTVRGRNVAGLNAAYLVTKQPDAPPASDASLMTRLFRAGSLYQLAPAESKLAHFLILLPVAALIICVFRNIIGLQTFGTFAPALVGIAFRELQSWPGVFVFVGLILAGWVLRRFIDRLHLLQVPRASAMLTLVILMLVALIILSHRFGHPFSRYVSLFPIVILVGMIERFWTIDEEDGARHSLRTLLVTLGIAGVIAVLLRWHWLDEFLFRRPETLGIVLAAQLVVGRYTGYRLMELYRFRDFTRSSTTSHANQNQNNKS